LILDEIKRLELIPVKVTDAPCALKQ
jgi:hypothetical protein